MKVWPRSLMGQMMLAVAMALLLAQGIGAFLAYRAGAERREAALLHSAAFRLLSATRGGDEARGEEGRSGGPRFRFRGFRLEQAAVSPLRAGERRDEMAERGPLRLAEVLEAQKEVLATARRLADAGSLMLAGRGDDYV